MKFMAVFNLIFVVAGVGMLAAGFMSGGPAASTLELTGGIFIATGIITLITARGMAGTMGGGALAAKGQDGTATVQSVQQTSMMINEQPVCRFELEVTVEGRGTWLVSHKQLVPMIALPRAQPGNVVAVKVDPVNPQKLIIVWGGPVVSGGMASGGAVVGGLQFAGVQRQSDILADGTPGMARIVELTHTGKKHDDGRPIFVIGLDVGLAGRAPFKTRSGYAVPIDKAGLLGLDMEVPIVASKRDVKNVAIDWDRL